VIEDVRTFVHKLLRRRQTDAAIATCNECNFSFKPSHVLLLKSSARSEGLAQGAHDERTGHGADAVRLRGLAGNSARLMTESSRRVSRYRKQSTR
jgi:hypothetical protein